MFPKCFHITIPQFTCFPATCRSLKKAGKKSGLYTVLLPSGTTEVYCEMEINGGAYTFIASDSLSNINQSDIDAILTDKTNVLFRLLKLDNTQPYTIIKQFINTGGLSVQLNAFKNYTQPMNHAISDYLFLGLLPKKNSRASQVEGFKSNGHNVSFTNCDGAKNNYFAFFSAKTATHTPVLACDDTKLDTNWRGTAISPKSSSIMPTKFFMLTEMHFGGCGCYVESGSWPLRANPAKATAIGLR